jgi:anthranilate synthase component 1
MVSRTVDVKTKTPVKTEIPMDLDTPVSAFLKLRSRNPLFLLESVEGVEGSARYSFIGLEAQAAVHIDGDAMETDAGGVRRRIPLGDQDPFDLLRGFFEEQGGRLRPEAGGEDGLSGLGGGLVGYAAYDMVRFIERLPGSAREVLGYPLAAFVVPKGILAFDHRRHVMRILYLGSPEEEEQWVRDLVRQLQKETASPSPSRSSSPPRPNKTKTEFCGMVERAREHILAGDAYQIVPSIRFQGETDSDPFQAYRALRMVNPSPYMYYLDLGFLQIAGSSPETLVRLDRGEVLMRPIAGTRPRGKDPTEDLALRQSLLGDEKERSEHVMLVDLARNDVGRVALPGTVRVRDFMSVESYSHVMHLASTVTGTLDAGGKDLFDVFRAVFPAGTVSGAPKVRAMELIEELEGERRGPYAGSVGYFGFNGAMDHAILIRTLLFSGGRYTLQAGAGIVADSEPEREHEEVLNKARGMFRALELAGEL